MISLDKEYCINWFKTNYSLLTGNLLGSGADGCVYALNNKAVKFSVLYNLFNNLDTEINNILYILKHLINKKNNLYVNIYDYGIIKRDYRNTINGPQEYILYFYIMDKLNPITEDEKKVFHSIISHEDRNLNKNYSEEKLKKVLDGLARGLDFDKEKIMLFYRKSKCSSLQQSDIHPRNIMKDSDNNFRFIDIDRVNLLQTGEDA